MIRAPGVRAPLHLFDQIARPTLRLAVDLRNIFPQDADTQELNAAEQVDGHSGRGPARQRTLGKYTDHERPDRHDEAEHTDDAAEPGDQPQRHRTERGDAIEGELDHLDQWILRLSRDAVKPVIEHAGTAKSKLRNDAAQEQVYLGVLTQRFQGAAAHETEIRMIWNDVDAQRVKQPVISKRRPALEPRIRVSRL